MTLVEIGMLLGSGMACGILVVGLLRLGMVSVAKRGEEANRKFQRSFGLNS